MYYIFMIHFRQKVREYRQYIIFFTELIYTLIFFSTIYSKYSMKIHVLKLSFNEYKRTISKRIINLQNLTEQFIKRLSNFNHNYNKSIFIKCL